jgi:hypothetical protein
MVLWKTKLTTHTQSLIYWAPGSVWHIPYDSTIVVHHDSISMTLDMTHRKSCLIYISKNPNMTSMKIWVVDLLNDLAVPDWNSVCLSGAKTGKIAVMSKSYWETLYSVREQWNTMRHSEGPERSQRPERQWGPLRILKSSWWCMMW